MNVANSDFHSEYLIDLYFPKAFAYIISFIPQNNPRRYVVVPYVTIKNHNSNKAKAQDGSVNCSKLHKVVKLIFTNGPV